MVTTVVGRTSAGTAPGDGRLGTGRRAGDGAGARRPVEPLDAGTSGLAGSRAGSRSDVLGDVLSETWRPGAARPVAVHVRPELLARLPVELPRPGTGGTAGEGLAGALQDVPVVVDAEIPVTPGYEVHRAPPPPPDGSVPRPSHPGSIGPARA